MDVAPSEAHAEDLRRELTNDGGRTASNDDVEQVQLAIDGELDAAELESLMDRLHLDQALGEAWRAAVAVRDELTDQDQAERSGRWKRWYIGSGLAAALVLALAAPLLVHLKREGRAIQREPHRRVIESRLQDGEALPRDAFDLEWEASGDHGAFRVQVLDVDLQVLHERLGVEDAQLRVPAAALADLESGATVLWWVETTNASGSRLRSPTFVQRVR